MPAPPKWPEDEARVIAAFKEYLEADGWQVALPSGQEYTDILARRGDELLAAEAKGRTSAPGLDADTMYGQLLRRMTHPAGTRYAVVGPSQFVWHILRVPGHVRNRLGIEVYQVDEAGLVSRR
jgi:hypothetical protein